MSESNGVTARVEELERLIELRGKGLIHAHERIDDLEEAIDDLEAQLQEYERLAQTALAVANEQAADSEDVTKKRVALMNTRDELVKRAALDTSESAGSGVTIDDITAMSKPQIHIYPQTVLDAWDELAESWGCFVVDENAAGRKRCRLDRSAVPEELARLVEHSLDRDDLVKRLMSGRSQQ